MKNRGVLFTIVFTIALMWAGAAFADPSFTDPALNVASGATVVLPPTVPSDPFHEILNSIIPVLLAGLTALLAWVSKNIKTWIAQKASEANTSESAAWYVTAMNLAGIAVKYAETKFGKDTATGEKKRAEAVSWLKARLYSIDPKMKINDSDLAAFVDAAYHDVFVAVSPLVPSPASK